MRASDTRWICCFGNCQLIINFFEAIIQNLREEIDINHEKNVVQAVGINKYRMKMKYVTFIISIVVGNIGYLFL